MIATTYSSQSVYLCNDQPNWSTAVRAKFTVPMRQVASKTNREEREAWAAELRAQLTYTALLDAAGSVALRSALSTWDNRPILVPFWPAVTLRTGGNPASIQGALKIWFEPEFTAWEIGTGANPSGFTPTAACLVAPILWGRFEKFPVLTTIDGADDTVVTFEFTEIGSAAFALTPNPITLTTSTVNTLVVPTLTTPFDWGSNKVMGEVRIKRGNIGFGRADADDFLPQVPRVKQTMNFDLMTTDEARYLLTLFKDRQGSVKPWQAYAPHNGTSLSLGRFYSDSLSLSWESWAFGGERVSSTVEFVTLPNETIALTGETPGVNMGGTPSRWFGYVVTDGTNTWRYTSHESDVTGPGSNVFTAAKISHGQISEEINLEVNDCVLTVHNWAGSPFTRLRNQPTAAALTVSIYEGLLSNPSAAQLLYTGTAQAPKTEGPRWQINLVGPSALLEMQGPRWQLQQTCNAVFGDSRCGKDLASVSVTHSLLSLSGGVGIFSTGAANTLPNKRFANGEARRTIGGVVQRYMIVDSYGSGSDLACVLAGTVSPVPTGTEAGWVLVPGCDGSKASCQGFSNYLNFRGAPFVPRDDPSMVVAQSAVGTTGKK
jgi:uncharacterized phage protein (TIGR02218 family)